MRKPLLAAPAPPLYNPAPRSWGGSSAGRASRSQCEGRGFDPLPLHQFPSFLSLTLTACKPSVKLGRGDLRRPHWRRKFLENSHGSEEETEEGRTPFGTAQGGAQEEGRAAESRSQDDGGTAQGQVDRAQGEAQAAEGSTLGPQAGEDRQARNEVGHSQHCEKRPFGETDGRESSEQDHRCDRRQGRAGDRRHRPVTGRTAADHVSTTRTGGLIRHTPVPLPEAGPSGPDLG
jgi:hypothetical protein